MNSHEIQGQLMRRAVAAMKRAFALDHWEIVALIDTELAKDDAPTDRAVYGECLVDYPECKAYLTINPDAHESDTDLLRTIRHEMLHIVAAPMEIYRRHVGAQMKRKAFDRMDFQWGDSVEGLIWNMERMLDAQGLTPESLIESENPND